MEKEFSSQRVGIKKNLIGQIILNSSLITSEQLEEALNRQKQEGGLLGDTLVKMGFISEEQLTMALANQTDLTYISVEKYNISREALQLVSRSLALKYCCIPLEKIGDVLAIAVSDPYNEEVISAVRSATQHKVMRLIGTKTGIEKAIKMYY